MAQEQWKFTLDALRDSRRQKKKERKDDFDDIVATAMLDLLTEEEFMEIISMKLKGGKYNGQTVEQMLLDDPNYLDAWFEQIRYNRSPKKIAEYILYQKLITEQELDAGPEL